MCIRDRRYRSLLKYTTNVWSKLVSWTVTDSKNIGNAKLMVLSSPSARDSGMVNMAHVSYYGKVVSVLDARLLKPSTLNNDSVDQAAALVGGLGLKAFR